MSNSEVAKTRGEYIQCRIDTSKKYYVDCKVKAKRHKLKTGWVEGGYRRWYVGSVKVRKYIFWGSKRKYYVSR